MAFSLSLNNADLSEDIIQKIKNLIDTDRGGNWAGIPYWIRSIAENCPTFTYNQKWIRRVR